jgi:hypothetical protein
MSNPTPHRLREPHPEVKDEWIERTIIEPYHHETDTDGRELYFGAVPEARTWIRVVVENDRLHTAYLDRRLIRRWGRP